MENQIAASSLLSVFAVLLSGFEDPTGLLITFPKDQIMNAIEQLNVAADDIGLVFTLEGSPDNTVIVGVEEKEEDDNSQ